jgi:hypothetical protein
MRSVPLDLGSADSSLQRRDQCEARRARVVRIPRQGHRFWRCDESNAASQHRSCHTVVVYRLGLIGRQIVKSFRFELRNGMFLRAALPRASRHSRHPAIECWANYSWWVRVFGRRCRRCTVAIRPRIVPSASGIRAGRWVESRDFGDAHSKPKCVGPCSSAWLGASDRAAGLERRAIDSAGLDNSQSRTAS